MIRGIGIIIQTQLIFGSGLEKKTRKDKLERERERERELRIQSLPLIVVSLCA
jgi:hypothetical protein